ncbi:hypothetical protein [Pseudomonas amygdali]|uniref:hypothetical protein n=1 Tax=Pseudomonas amygdali TaxID=47877 RepID=UPI000C332E73|nr:hypothetical protein [Pseudomonas amygdali]PWD01956.1 hypothetical protein CX658_18535 [Pseudomonas amygdali pv. lachrymans]
MFETMKPVVTPLEAPHDGERHSHPAYGLISVAKTSVNPGGVHLFGSDLNHRSVLTVTLHTAIQDRHLSRDWYHSDDEVMQFQMSEAQWATFVSSVGGAGVPITYEFRPIEEAPLQLIPRIEKVETMTETFEREVREKCEGYVATATELVERLAQCAEEGKMSKAALKEVLGMAQTLSVGLPNSMGFIQKQMRETMERNVTAGKIELEAFVNDMAMRMGFEALREQSPQLIEQTTSTSNE